MQYQSTAVHAHAVAHALYAQMYVPKRASNARHPLMMAVEFGAHIDGGGIDIVGVDIGVVSAVVIGVVSAVGRGDVDDEDDDDAHHHSDGASVEESLAIAHARGPRLINAAAAADATSSAHRTT